MTLENIEKCNKIAKHYRYEEQKKQTLQELAELACLLTRRPDQIVKMTRVAYMDMLLDEMADCTIMLQQLDGMLHSDPTMLQIRIAEKVDRQLLAIAEDGQE